MKLKYKERKRDRYKDVKDRMMDLANQFLMVRQQAKEEAIEVREMAKQLNQKLNELEVEMVDCQLARERIIRFMRKPDAETGKDK
jgi:hypothetical protein